VKEKIGFLNAFYRIKDRNALTEKLSLREFVRSFVRPYSRCDPKNAYENPLESLLRKIGFLSASYRAQNSAASACSAPDICEGSPGAAVNVWDKRSKGSGSVLWPQQARFCTENDSCRLTDRSRAPCLCVCCVLPSFLAGGFETRPPSKEANESMNE